LHGLPAFGSSEILTSQCEQPTLPTWAGKVFAPGGSTAKPEEQSSPHCDKRREPYANIEQPQPAQTSLKLSQMGQRISYFPSVTSADFRPLGQVGRRPLKRPIPVEQKYWQNYSSVASLGKSPTPNSLNDLTPCQRIVVCVLAAFGTTGFRFCFGAPPHLS
jgi:hypothetical protein